MSEKPRKKPLILKKTPIKKQNPRQRSRNFEEVVLGYTEQEAIEEAKRCLGCRKKPCIAGCPVGIDIPAFVSALADGKPDLALSIIKEQNILPGVCGRVCPQEDQCEAECTLGKKGDPLAIGKLERFLADREASWGNPEIPRLAEKTELWAGVVGSGPAGITVASELAKMGYRVTIYEGLHAPGGVLTYGIPEFRLPNQVVKREIDLLEAMGVEIMLNFVVGKTASLTELLSRHHSVFLGLGAGLPLFLGIPGENLNGVYSANEFLVRNNLMFARKFPEYDTPIKKREKVIVVGGGNVAMDSARTALRLGAKEVTVVYRRSRAEMPARIEETEHAEEEGIDFLFLTNPVEAKGEDGWLKSVVCQKMELGEPDESGRRRPVPIEGAYTTIEAEILIAAIGAGPNPLLIKTAPQLKLTKRGYIEVNPKSLETSIPGLYAGGDIITGAATVIDAMGAGKVAAAAMNAYMLQNTEVTH
ncbi:MAG: NADPH-dependent glutamate synthase [Actinomycetota bacterium]|nr:NADPH-dependent glutamate synthase [Actinomycetota bacterium]